MSEIHQPLFCSEIVKRAPSILESAQWADCKFLVGAKPHQVVVGGYKLVMALASPVFEAMFYGTLAETRDHIPIVDVELEVFKNIIQYMYTGKINISSWSEACELYYAAKKYMLEQLMEICSEYLQTNLNSGNVCQIYEHSLLFEDDALTQECNKLFSDDTADILKDNSFIAAQINTVAAIFSLDELNLDSELDLIEAAARYARAQYIQSEDDTSAEKQLPNCGASNLKLDTAGNQQMRSVVRNIRFLVLTPQQYASCTARYSLLTLPEDHAVLVNIASDKPDVAMPSGFSTSRDDRVNKRTFDCVIAGFNNNEVTSQAHYFRKLKWQIKLAPRGRNGMTNDFYLEFFLVCTNESRSSSWSCDTSGELRIFSHTPNVTPLIFKIQRVFSRDYCKYAFPQSVKSVFLNNYYLRNGSVEVEVFIKINKVVGI